TADVSFRHAVGADRRAHRSIDDGDSTLEDFLKRMLVGSSHFSLIASRMASTRMALELPLTAVARIFHYSETANILPRGRREPHTKASPEFKPKTAAAKACHLRK